MADKRVFIVTGKVQQVDCETKPRLIRAERRSHVEAFLLNELNIVPATADDAFKAAGQGVSIEEVTSDVAA